MSRAAATPSSLAACPPVPVALMSRLEGPRRGSGRRLEDLEEDFVLLDHAELAARPLLDGVQADLEIADFGLEGVVARLELPVGLVLRANLLVDLPYAEPASLAEPQRILNQGDQDDQ